MAQVPMHGGRSISRTGIPDARRSAASTALAEGAGVERARADTSRELAALGGTVARIGVDLYRDIREKERRRADEVALLEANNRLDAFELGLNDPNGGAFHTRGKAAFEMPEKVDQDFNALADEISQGLATPEQKIAFDKMRGNRGQAIGLNIRRHVAGEMRSYEQGQLEGTLTNAVSLAGANAQDPARVATEIGKGEFAIRSVAANRGQSEEQTEQQLTAFRTGAHLSVISNLVAQDNAPAAGAYFEETKDQIAGDKWDEVERLISEGKTAKQARENTERILAEGGSLAEQRTRAKNSIENPKVLEEVLQQLEHESNLKDKAERDADEGMMRRAADILDKGGSFDAIPPADRARMSPAQRSGLRSYQKALAEGIDVETDLPSYYGLMRQAGESPDAFAKVNLLNFRGRLSEADFKSLSGLQLSIRNKDKAAADTVLAGFSTKQEVLDGTLIRYGIDPKAKPDTPEGKAIANLQRMLDRRIDTLQQSTGKKASNTDIQTALDELLSQTTTISGTWAGLFTRAPFYDTSKRIIDLTVDDIPSATKTAIESARRRRGLPVSDATTLETYLEMQVK